MAIMAGGVPKCPVLHGDLRSDVAHEFNGVVRAALQAGLNGVAADEGPDTGRASSALTDGRESARRPPHRRVCVPCGPTCAGASDLLGIDPAG